MRVERREEEREGQREKREAREEMAKPLRAEVETLSSPRSHRGTSARLGGRARQRSGKLSSPAASERQGESEGRERREATRKLEHSYSRALLNRTF